MGAESGSGRPSDLIRSYYGSAGRPLGGMQSLGGPSKPGLVKDPQSLNPTIGLNGPSPVLISNGAGSFNNGSMSLKDSGWANVKETNTFTWARGKSRPDPTST